MSRKKWTSKVPKSQVSSDKKLKVITVVTQEKTSRQETKRKLNAIEKGNLSIPQNPPGHMITLYTSVYSVRS